MNLSEWPFSYSELTVKQMALLNILTASNHTVTVTLLYKYLLTIMKGLRL